MVDTRRERVEAAFPALDVIEDQELHDGVVTAWVRSLDETDWELPEVPWFPPTQHDLDLPDERLVDHVNDVCHLAIDVADGLATRRPTSLSRDMVVAGALVHDISKLYEFDPEGDTPVYELLGHSPYGVHVVLDAGLPVELAHIVLSHTDQTNVSPATVEAEIVRRADQVAAAAIKLEAVDDLRDG